MRVISYARFSSPKQARGDSLRRQTALAEAWCVRNGHTLDTALRLTDEGKSGWSGANARTGALAQLLNMAGDGRIEPGTILLIEALDRLTRQDLTTAVPLMLGLLKAGLSIVTLQDGKEWTQRSMRDTSDFVMSVLLFARGHEESQRKSQLVRAAFEAHRQRRSNQIFGSAPGWLSRDDKHSSWRVDKRKAAAVNRVFELAAQGWGSVQIARLANQRNWVVPTRLGNKGQGWHARMAGHILRNRAALGEHEFRLRGHEHNEKHWQGQRTGIVVPDFYPRIVSDDLWHRARAAISARDQGPRRRDSQYYNIWLGLLYCGHCGAPVHRKTEHRGKHGSGQLICSANMAGKTTCPRASIKLTDYALLSEICRIAGPYLATDSSEDLVVALAVAQSRLKELDAAADRVAAAIADSGDALPALTRKARELAQQRQEILTEIAALDERISTAPHSLLDTGFADSVLKVLYKPGEKAMGVRVDCNTRLRRAFEKIWLWPYDVALAKTKEGLHVVVPMPMKKVTDLRPFLKIALSGDLTPPG